MKTIGLLLRVNKLFEKVSIYILSQIKRRKKRKGAVDILIWKNRNLII